MLARLTTYLLVLLAAFMFSACGGSDDSSSDDKGSSTTTESTTETTDTSTDSATSGTTLELGVKGNELKFDKGELTAPAGSVTIKLTNTSSIQHNIGIEDADGKSFGEGELAGQGETSEVTADLEPGTYTYFCSPHKSAGMTGTLTIT